jgi:basic membrane protein A
MFSEPLKKKTLRAGIAIAVTAGVLLATGCSGRTTDTADTGSEDAKAGTKVAQFAIVTPEKESDYGWNQQGIWAAQSVADELGIELDDHSNIGYDNTETILTQVAEGGNDFIIAHASGFNTAGHRVGLQTGVPTLVVDFDKNEPGKVSTVITQAQEGAYLAGVAAAKKTATKTVGIVASAEDLNWFLMAGGFAQGVYSIDPSINVIVAYVGPAGYGDSAGGSTVTTQVIAAGADVIFGMGDGATIGYLQAIETADAGHPIFYIATIGDVTSIVDDPDMVLTSVLWNFSSAYKAAIADIEAGTFGTKTYELTVANGGLSLQKTDSLSGDIATAVDEAKAGIIDGSVKIERTTDKDAVQAVIDAKS